MWEGKGLFDIFTTIVGRRALKNYIFNFTISLDYSLKIGDDVFFFSIPVGSRGLT